MSRSVAMLSNPRMNNKTNEVSHHRVALSCLQTAQYNVMITRFLFLLHVVAR